ncbi:74615b36-def3-4a6b-8020-9815de4efb29 [Thermothielavioides terrestris]|uniref:74615b36-def3-4a6b-8020-9815de4efb29 n=1 Tax=Thermothielavioides terrestris TaxID=2587410 RepID=A0A446BKM8_9PEZI|nr:74615b36-def3-4a6b-8020-9815de4efb29 [Thermothielavioides terrestris]
MLSILPYSFCAPAPVEASFSPLFRLLDDFDSYSRQVQCPSTGVAHRRQHLQRQLAAFNPKFDVRETENAYELHGELPGLERDNVNIEFTDAQTLVIRGRIERNYDSESDANSNTAVAQQAQAATTAPAPEPSETETAPEPRRRTSHQATVEDDPEDENTPASTPASTPTASPKQEAVQPAAASLTKAAAQPETQVQAGAPRSARYYRRWERSVGEFSRAFAFPARVDHDGVTASLNNGLLSVTVPKARKYAPRRIEISSH